MEAHATMEVLDDGSLGVIMGFFPPKLRASTLSLVCKTWRRVEREHPHRLIVLNLRPQDVNDAFLTWHFRDTSRLKAVRVAGNAYRIMASDTYIEGVPRVLRHLHAWAPSLRILELVPPVNFQGKETGSVSSGILPLVATLSRLECLALRQWDYNPEDIAAFHHLTRLQVLQVLELSELDLYFQDNSYNSETKHGMLWETAANELQDCVLGLQLTSLILTKVDFAAYDGLLFLAEKEVGSLTNLRSLTLECNELTWDGQFPYINQLVNLTRLDLTGHTDDDSLRNMLAGLYDLKELELRQTAGLAQVVLPSAAEVTKLTVEGFLRSVMPLGSVLPLESMRHVESLMVDCNLMAREEMEWPGGWGQLTSLTRLDLSLAALSREDDCSPIYYLPEFILEIVSLKSMKLTVGYEMFDRMGDGYVLLLTARLPLLYQLQIEVRGIPEGEEVRLGQTCASLSLTMPDWGCSWQEVAMGPGLGHNRTQIVTFTPEN